MAEILGAKETIEQAVEDAERAAEEG